jgi:hypothetical protein
MDILELNVNNSYVLVRIYQILKFALGMVPALGQTIASAHLDIQVQIVIFQFVMEFLLIMLQFALEMGTVLIQKYAIAIVNILEKIAKYQFASP